VGGNGHLPRGRGGPLQEKGQSRDCGRIESWQYKKANILTDSQATKGLKKSLSSSPKFGYTANKFGLMYCISEKELAKTRSPNFIYIFPKSFMIFC
jgi:hypothetical protein